MFETIGFTDRINALPIAQIVNTIKANFGLEFISKHFGDEITPFAFGASLQALLSFGLLKSPNIMHELESNKFKDTIHNIKNNERYDFTHIATLHGKKACETIFKNGILVRHGMFPQDFADITQDHHQYPAPLSAERFKDVMMIHLQRQTSGIYSESLYKSFDVMYFANKQ